jgi:putative transposase
VQPESPDPPAHDAFIRLLPRLEPDPASLREEARPLVHREGRLLILDDSTLEKHHAKKIDLVARHWSGKHKRVVWGINRITMAWTDGDRVVPCADRLYDKAKDGLIKNGYFRANLLCP